MLLGLRMVAQLIRIIYSSCIFLPYLPYCTGARGQGSEQAGGGEQLPTKGESPGAVAEGGVRDSGGRMYKREGGRARVKQPLPKWWEGERQEMRRDRSTDAFI